MTPVTSGRQPQARYAHSMHLVEWMNSILIYGGRYDSDILHKDSKSQLLNDIWILKLDNFDWIEISNKGDIPSPVYAH